MTALCRSAAPRRWTLLVAALGLLTLLPRPGLAQRENRNTFLKTSPQLLAAFRKVVAQPRQGTVQVRCDGRDVALGTVVDAEGWVLTKASVLAGVAQVVLADGKEYDAQVLERHDGHDLALLKVSGVGLTPVQFRPSGEAPVGSWAVSVGTSADPVALGVVSVAARNLPAPRAPKGPSLSGGYLGVALQPDEEGAKIAEVLPDTGASRAGMRVNDVIVSIAGTNITDPPGLVRTLSTYKAGDVVPVRIRRGDREIDLKATLGPRPPSRGDIQNRMGSKLSDRIDGFPTVLQHDSVVLPEQCGGPLVDLEGRVIGINVARAGRTESYAVPSEVVQPLLQQWKSRHGSAVTQSVAPAN